MSGVGVGKMSQISGCDYGVGEGPWMITSHEMGHSLDLAHAEMWTNTDSSQVAMKDPGSSKNGKACKQRLAAARRCTPPAHPSTPHGA